MKLKFLSIMIAVAIALAFTSCGDKSGSGSESGPTGDIEKDAKTLVEKITSAKTVDEAQKVLQLVEEYDKFYKEKGGEEFKKWGDAGRKALSDPKVKDAANNLRALAAESAAKETSTGSAAETVENTKIFTGNPDIDAKAYVEKIISLMENVETAEDISNVQRIDKELKKEMQEAYRDKTAEDVMKFQEEASKLMTTGDMGDRYQKLQQKMMTLKQ